MIRRAASVGMACMAMACTDLTDARRWSSMRQIPGSGGEVRVNVYAAPAPTVAAGPANPVASMSDAAQAAYVTALDRRTTARSAAEFRSALRAPIAPAAEDPEGQAVSDRVRRVLVATLSRPSQEYHPGDRILRAVVYVRPLDFTFGDYTVAQTDRRTIDVSTVSRSTTRSGQLSLTAAPPGSPVGGSAQAGLQQQVGTTMALREPQEELTIDITPTCLTIGREGGYGTDLTGNARIDLTTLADAPARVDRCGLGPEDTALQRGNPGIQRYFVADRGLTFGPKGPSVRTGDAPGRIESFPQRAFRAQVTLDYVLRRVEGGTDYYEEGKQAVALVTGHNVACRTVVPSDQLTPPLWIVREGGPTRSTVNADVNGELVPLAFLDAEAARAAASWLTRTRATRLGAIPLNRPRGPIFSNYRVDAGSYDTDCAS